MKKVCHIDYVLTSTLFLLLVLGILILGSTSAVFSQEKFGSPTYFLFHQIEVGLFPGLLLGYIAFKIPLSFLKKYAIVLLGVTLLFMILVFIPKIGISLWGATRWVGLGSISFQPSEFLKLTSILYMAAWLSSQTKFKKNKSSLKSRKRFGFKTFQNNLDTLSDLGKQTLISFLVIISLISLLLILQPDISTLIIVVGVLVLMYFLAGTPIRHSILITLAGITAIVFLIKIAPYRFNRLIVFFKPEIDPMGIGYQVKQALITIGSGGIWGRGLGLSVQKFGFLPQPMGDSIFAIFSEEAGFIGSSFLVLLFLIFAWRGFEIAKKSTDKFSQLAGLGICSWIVLQSFVNIGSMVGILPLTGIPLPFISYGGSHVIAELMGAGILLNISKNT